MKIIKRGVSPQENLYRFTCRNCHSELECKQEEMTYRSSVRNEEWWEVSCPVCQNKCYVYKENRVKGENA